MAGRLERNYQPKLIKKIKEALPGCIVLKNDPTYIQGVPDLTVLNNSRWATLEVKRSKGARRQPNQEHYVKVMNEMSFSAVVYPENEGEVIDALQRALSS